MHTQQTLVDVLRHRAATEPDRPAYVFLVDGEHEEATLTYAELDRAARAVAVRLQEEARPGQHVLLLFPPGLDYIVAFFGCLYANAVAVPVYPPKQNRSLARLQSIVQDSGADAALTLSSVRSRISGYRDTPASVAGLRWITIDDLSEGSAAAWKAPSIDCNTLAFLQYTSGSTSTPKGVMVSHGNLIHNERIIQCACRHTAESTFVGWLPLYHDMGLIGNVLQPLFIGALAVLMAPAAFLQKPLRWLEAIARYRGATSGAPDFAYDLCARRITQEQASNLDLSSWKVAFNGAEPVHVETMKRFSAAFRVSGFRSEAFFPCYGLAEGTLFVSGRFHAAEGAALAVDRDALSQHRIELVEASDCAGVQLPSCGTAFLGQQVAIVNPQTQVKCGPDQVGEIWVSGESIAKGYWNKPDETAATFHAFLASGAGPFLRTGDLGFMPNGEVFVTGRLKDLIILRGRNHYPQDIERTAEATDAAVKPGSGAAFTVDIAGERRLVVVLEAHHRHPTGADEILRSVRKSVAEEHEILAHAVVLVGPGGVPKTSSGKVRRQACRREFLDGVLNVLAQSTVDLPSIGENAGTPSETHLDSVEALESWLAESVSKRLGISAGSLDISIPLAAYGLDSMAATELSHQLQTLGAAPFLSAPLQSLGIAQIAGEVFATIQGARGLAAREPDLSTVREYPLSPGQQAIFFLHQLDLESVAYQIARAVQLRPDIDAQRLREAFQALTDRHGALRTIFAVKDGVPMQYIHPHIEAAFTVEDASSWSHEALGEELDRRAHRRMDIERRPAFEVVLFRKPNAASTLLIVAHHIICDFWTLALFAREIEQLYSGVSRMATTPASLDYTRYVDFQRELLTSPAGQEHAAYWRGEFAAGVPALNLPTDHPRPSRQTYRGAELVFPLEAELMRDLRTLAAQNETTLFVVLFTVFQILLHRWTGDQQIVTGSPAAGRTCADFSEVAGYFVNSVALRTSFAGDPRVNDLLAAARERLAGAILHQDYPFSLVVELLQPDRDASRAPVFQTMFAMQSTPPIANWDLGALALSLEGAPLNGDLGLQPRALRSRTAQFEISLAMAEVGGRLVGVWQYNTDLFEAETIARMAQHYSQLLHEIVREPTTRVSQLSLLTEQEQAAQRSWNRTTHRYPSFVCLHEHFEAQVEATPQATALVCGEERLTYQALNSRANVLALRLRQAGVTTDLPVGVFAERSTELVVALLAVLKAGGAYVPLDPAYPEERLQFMVSDSDLRIVLTQPNPPLILPGNVDVLDIQSNSQPDDEDVPNLKNVAAAESLAYIIYTSGSTGRPKGVMNTHGAIGNRLLWMQQQYGLTESDRVLQKTPFSFDVSVWEFFWPLISGACLVMAAPGAHRDPGKLGKTINDERITTIHFVPSMLAAFLEDPDVDQCPSLQRVICSGEVLPHALQELFLRRFGTRLYNLYGPTEAAVDVTHWECHLGASVNSVPIGHPIWNTQIHLLDAYGNPVPVGVPGELYIGGVSLARGYVGQVAMTAERFVPDPFTDAPGRRLYRTGDLARYRQDGRIEYLRRTDHQVKIRGFRIETGEIEAALAAHKGVRAAAVVPSSGHSGHTRLIAYVVRVDSSISTPALRDHLSRTVPDFMIPSAFCYLPELPLTPSGKINRLDLPKYEPDTENLADFATPETDAERVLLEVWQDVLALTTISVTANFFALGGDSIRSIRVKALARAKGLEISLPQIFQHQTIRQLAGAATQVGEEADPLPYTPFQMLSADDLTRIPGDVEDAYPVTRLQLGLMFHAHHDPGYEVYVTSLRVSAILDSALLQQAADELSMRHAMLRTSFHLTGFEEPLQLLHRQAPIRVESIDLGHMPPAAQDEFLRRWCLGQRKQPFDWSTAPLVRLYVHRRDASSFQLTLVEPYLDGWSVSLLLTELLRSYGERLAGRHPALLPIHASFAQYVSLERAAIESNDDREYWRNRLADSLSCALPPREDSGEDLQAGHIERVDVSISENTSHALKRVADRIFVPLKSVLLAAHLRVVALLSGHSDMVTGLLYNGRPETNGGEQILGLFLNAMPFRVAVDEGSWIDLIRRVWATEQELLPFRRYPLAEIQRQTGRQNLFDTAFNFTHFHYYQQLKDIPGVHVANGYASDQTFFDLTAQFNLDHAQSETRVRLSLDYRSNRFTKRQAQRFGQYYVHALEAIASTPEASVAERSLLSSEEAIERERWNDTSAPRFEAHCLHALFEKQVESTPEHPAVLFEGVPISFSALNRRANRVAHFLREQGVGPDTLAGVVMERSVEMVVALLAILKAGGAYVPLDPSYPPERLGFMAHDARLSCLLADQASAPLASSLTANVIVLDSEGHDFENTPDRNPVLVTTPDHLAYVIYTSGSTGKPKGAMNSHRAIVNRLLWMQDEFQLQPDDRVLQKTSFSFDVSVWEFFWPLLTGACLVLARPGGQRDAAYLSDVIRRERITTIHFVPPMLRAFLEEAPEACTSLRRVICSGSELFVELQEKFFALHTANLYNLYGPTEAAVDVTWWRCQRNDSRSIVPIGRPIANVQIHILNPQFLAVPVLVHGDLYIGGVGVGRGYVGRPDLTAAAFLPDPFSTTPGARLYRTGDSARWLPDGSIEFLGRTDQQVKIRGFRIEPGEVEAALHSHPDIKECAVVVPEDSDGPVRLVAYAVASVRASFLVAQIREFLAGKLPPYMVPSKVILLSTLPKTPSGKIDRLALARRKEAPARERALHMLDRVEQLSEEEVSDLLAGNAPQDLR